MSTDTPLPSRYRWGRRHLMPAIIVAVMLLARLAIVGMEKFDVLMDYHFDAFMGFQFLSMFAVLLLGLWFLFLSGYIWPVKAAGIGLVLGVGVGFYFASFVIISVLGIVTSLSAWLIFPSLAIYDCYVRAQMEEWLRIRDRT